MVTTEQKIKSDAFQQVVYAYPPVQDDEISLLDIWRILNSQRKLIFSIIIAGAIIALVVAMLLPQVYRSEVVFLPPLASDIEQLNVPDFYEVTVDDLYGKFIRNLQSSGLREKFF